MKPLSYFRHLVLAAILSSTASLSAIDLYWDADLSGGVCGGGAGTWNTTSLQWNTNDCAGTYSIWGNATTNSATFQGDTAYTVTLGGNMTANKVTNATTLATTTLGLTMTGSQITFGGTTPTIHTPNKLAMNSILKGAVTLTKTGAGQLQFNNNGQTISKYIIKGGIISSANTNKWGTGVGNAQDAVTLDGGGIGNDSTSQTYNYWGITLGSGGGSIGLSSATLTVTLNTKITGSGALNLGGSAAATAGFNAAGIYVLGDTGNNYTGTTTISKGTLKLGASGVLSDGSAVQVNSGTTLDFNGFDEGVRSLQGSSGTSAGTVSLGSQTLTFNRTSGETSFPGVINGTGSIVKTGAATQHLIGANTYSGKTIINAGVLGIVADSGLGTVPASTVADQLQFGGGTLLSSNAAALDPKRGITLTGNGTWLVADANQINYAGIITGPGNFTKSGLDASTLVLDKANTYVGSTTVSGGTLRLGVTNAIQFSPIIAINGTNSVMDLNAFNPTLKGLSGTGTIKSSGGPVSINITNGVLAAGTSLTGNAVGLLTVEANLTLLDSTNRWELGALYDDVDGTNGVSFDQVQVTSGELTLNNSILSIGFTGTGVAPDFATPFWQNPHTWTVVKMVAPGANTALNNFVSVKTNAYIYAGTFATSVDAGTGNILLNYTPNGPTAPIILAQPLDKNGIESNNVSITVSATGTAPLSYQWYFGVTPIATGTTATLTITNAQTADGGSYHVVIGNTVDTLTSSNATLTIIYPPVLTTAPGSQTIVQGSPVTFSVAASGTSPFTYQWKKNGSNIGTATNTSYTILGVTTNDAANYSVAVTNIAGGLVSTNAALTVIVPPVLTVQPTNKTVNLGSSATFTVAASGTAPFTYQWKKDGSNISTATNTSYTILSVTSGDIGNYSVGVTNIAGGVVSTNAALALITAASPKVSLTVTNNSAVLSWSSEAGRVYRPQLKANLNETNWTSIPPDITASGTNSVITNSTSATTNQFYRVLALP